MYLATLILWVSMYFLDNSALPVVTIATLAGIVNISLFLFLYFIEALRPLRPLWLVQKNLMHKWNRIAKETWIKYVALLLVVQPRSLKHKYKIFIFLKKPRKSASRVLLCRILPEPESFCYHKSLLQIAISLSTNSSIHSKSQKQLCLNPSI